MQALLRKLRLCPDQRLIVPCSWSRMPSVKAIACRPLNPGQRDAEVADACKSAEKVTPVTGSTPCMGGIISSAVQFQAIIQDAAGVLNLGNLGSWCHLRARGWLALQGRWGCSLAGLKSVICCKGLTC